jgi:hypothetical protein
MALKEAIKTARKNCSGEGTPVSLSPKKQLNGGKPKGNLKRPSPARSKSPKRKKLDNTPQELRRQLNRPNNPYSTTKHTPTPHPLDQQPTETMETATADLAAAPAPAPVEEEEEDEDGDNKIRRQALRCGDHLPPQEYGISDRRNLPASLWFHTQRPLLCSSKCS